MQHLAKKIR